MEQELEMARDIQLGIMPTDFAAAAADGAFEIFAILQPAREVGGDLYDFFCMSPKTLSLVVADVSGKGAGAALFMAREKCDPFAHSTSSGTEWTPASSRGSR